MRKAMKLLCVVLVFAMALSCVAFSAFADGEGTTDTATATTAAPATTQTTSSTTGKLSDVGKNEIYYQAVMTLNAMDVIKGYEDGTFKPEQNVTRAEFTAMLMRTLGLGGIGSTSAANLPFSDVSEINPDINWAIPNINTAYEMGIINGYEDGSFKPQANVAYEEAIKMIVCTLGYGKDIDVSTTPWYANYITIASQQGITKNTATLGSPETPASRACIAQLLYDSLEVKLIENEKQTDKTILSDYLKIHKGRGVISSNGVTSLTSPNVSFREDEVMIYAQEDKEVDYQEHAYQTSDKSIVDKLGCEIEFYFKLADSGYRTLLFYILMSDEPLVINANDVEPSGTTATRIKYYETPEASKEKSASIDPDNVVVYNEKLYGYDRSSSRFDTDMIPEVGQITLIDSDNNGAYDVIIITSYDIYYVSSKSATTYEIVDNLIRPATSKTLKLDVNSDPHLSIVNKNGAEVDYSSIVKGNIICYAESNSLNGGDLIRKAVVITDKVTGTVEGLKGQDKITINGKEYMISKAAPWLTGSSDMEAPRISDSGTYLLDINGDVVAYTKEETSVNVKYGYIEGYSAGKDTFDDSVKLRILTSEGKVELIPTFKSTKVDGITCPTGRDVINEIINNAEDNINEGNENHLIKYTTRTSGGETVLDSIYTARGKESGSTLESDKLYTISTITRDSKASYSSSSKQLSCAGGVKIGVSSAVIIMVPDDPSAYDDYKKTTASSIFNTNTKYNVEVYDVSPTNIAKIVVVYGADQEQDITYSTPLCIVNEVSEARNEEKDEDMFKVSGFTSSSSKASGDLKEWLSNDSEKYMLETLAIGDIFRAGTDSDGFMKLTSPEKNIVYSINGGNEFGLYNEKGKTSSISDSDYYSVILGTVYSRDDYNIQVAPEFLYADEECSDESMLQSFMINDFKSAQILFYDAEKKDLEITRTDYESAFAGLTAVKDGTEPSKVLIYQYRGAVRLLCILPMDVE